MIKIYSKQDSSKLLHIINRYDKIIGRTDVAPEDQFIQLATLRMEKGKTFRPHKHIWKLSSSPEVIAQESWVVIKGSVRIFMYDIDDTFIKPAILRMTGDTDPDSSRFTFTPYTAP